MNRTAFLFAAALALPAFAADGPKEGKWEYTAQMQMPGMPAMPKLPAGMPMPKGMSMGAGGMTTTFERCIKKDDLVPKNDSGREHCTITKMERKGNTVNWASTCDTPHGKADGEGTATYTGDTMTSTMHVKGQSNDHPFEMTQTITGKYLGPCS